MRLSSRTMPNRLDCMIKRVFVALVALSAASVGRSEPTAIEQGYRQMYNLQFDAAHRTFSDWARQHPQDPLGPVSDAAAYLFAEFDRLHILQSEFFIHDEHFITDHRLAPDPAVKEKFDAAINNAATLADRQPQDPDSRFAALLCHGLRSDYMALIEKRYGASFKEMKTARGMAEQLLAEHPKYYDAWVAVGVENYMLSTKAAPIRWLLRLGGGQTDKTVGIEKLRLAAEKGHYLLPFARLLLAVAALRDHNTDQARDILADLSKEFPRNNLYVQELARF
jgi:hypothetical protein